MMRSLIFLLLSCAVSAAEPIEADIWADNWFALSINGQMVVEDPVPITTERSFNAVSTRFEAKRPFVIGIIAKDFKQDATGLEYIGSRRQQMGDGGLIAQFHIAGQTVSTGADWRCLVVNTAPLNTRCEKARNPSVASCGAEDVAIPKGWDTLGFDASSWPEATTYSASDVRPKDGYDRIRWDRDAEFIWGPDLKTNNTVLCRLEVN